MTARVNFTKAIEARKEVTWITRNPGRQHTSSINPIFKDVREWYGEKNYTPFLIGIPVKIFTMIFSIWKKKKTYWYRLPKDIFKMLMDYIMYNYASVGYNIATGNTNIVPRSMLVETPKTLKVIEEEHYTCSVSNKQMLLQIIQSEPGIVQFLSNVLDSVKK